MKKIIFKLILVGLLFSALHLLSAFSPSTPMLEPLNQWMRSEPEPELKQAALLILQSKCNSCHRRQNPFKVFSLKNMDRHAKKIYKQVFVYERMPKGNEVTLTEEEYQTLKIWLNSKNIF